MEIIHLILGKANPNRMNGVNKVVFQLATEQVASGRNISVWGITKDISHNYGERNFDTKLFKANANPFFISEGLKKAILLKNAGTIFHLHGGWIPVYFIISKILHRNNIPFVLTPHGSYNTIAMKRSRWIKKLYFGLFESYLLRRSKNIHAIGQSEIQGLNNFYPNKKSLLIPYGFKFKESTSISKRTYGAFIIGFVGRLDIYTKGLDLLLHAFKEFQFSRSNVELWIIGDGSERGKLEGMISELDLEDKVVLWGSKFGSEKEYLMFHMNVFAHPSRNEGLPSSVLEACSMGIPSIVSKATNLSNYILDNNAGISVENEDEVGLAKAISFLYNKRNNLSELSKNARRMIQNSFNWKQIVIDFDQLYI